MSFRLTAKASSWKAAIMTILSQANEEAIFEIREDGLLCKARDPSKVSLASFVWKKENFSTYETSDVNVKIGFKATDWKTIISRFKKDSDVTVSWKGDGLAIIVSDCKEFSAPLISPDYLADVSKIPEKLTANFEVSIEMPISSFQEICDDMKVFSAGITIEVDKNELMFYDKGEYGKSRVLWPEMVQGKEKGRYQIDYLSSISRDMAAFAEKITIQLKQDYPLSLMVDVPNLGLVQFYVAPMIEQKT